MREPTQSSRDGEPDKYNKEPDKYDKESKKYEEEYDVVVIGGGFAGTFTVDQICKEGHFKKVLFLEAGDEILGASSSSFNECYKLHTGLHYATDKQTALQCLEDSVNFIKDFPNCILGYQDTQLPWRNGRHYLMSNSLISKEQVKDVCDSLRTTYAKLIKEDRNNAVFGPAERFIRYLEPEEYQFVGKKIPCPKNNNHGWEEAEVILGIETPESQIDLKALRNYLIERLRTYNNLTTLLQHEVKHLQFVEGSLDYEIVVNDKLRAVKKKIRVGAIVNCTWQNIEQLDYQLGYYIPDSRITRVKVSLLVELPEELKNLNTCIFFSGPFCSVTNLGNGEAIITYEPATNVGFFKPLDTLVPFFKQREKWWKVTQSPLDVDSIIGMELAEEILLGAAKFIPALKNAVVKEVRKGHVKIFLGSNEQYSLDSPDSPIHRRRENGIEQKGLCYISHSGMKMTYTANTAKETVEILQRNFTLRNSILRLIKKIKIQLRELLPEEIYKELPVNVVLHNTLRNSLLDCITFTFNTLDKLIDEKYVIKISEHIAKAIIEKERSCQLLRLIANIKTQLRKFLSEESFNELPSNIMLHKTFRDSLFECITSTVNTVDKSWSDEKFVTDISKYIAEAISAEPFIGKGLYA